VYPPTKEDEGREDPGQGLPGFAFDPIGVIRRRWPWMLAVILAGSALCAVYLKTWEPSYQARATILVASQRISEDFVRSTIETDQLEKVSAILGELLSRRNLVDIVVRYDLFSQPDGASVELAMEEKVSITRSAIAIAADRSNPENQRRNSSATVFEILFSHGDPVKAAEVANDIASSFTDIHLRMRSRQARVTTEFLRRELGRTTDDLMAQERAIREFKQAYRGSLPSELGTSLGRLDRLQSQRQSLALQIASAESRLATLAATGSDVEPDSPEAMLRALQSRLREQRTLFTDDHPNIVSLQNQIASFESRAEEGLADDLGLSPAAGAAQLELRELRKQLQETVVAYDSLDRRVALVPEREEELAALEQRAVILREGHQDLQRKVAQAELSEAVESAQQGERANVLDEAVPPAEPISSSLKIVIVLVVGTILGAMGLAVLLEVVDGVIVTEAEIEDRYQFPVLGSISKLG